MDTNTRASLDAEELRRRAEKRMQETAALEGSHQGEINTLRLVNEMLKIHQIELEIQNEELVQAREELEAEKTRYAELYEFAPVGYLNLDECGVLRKINLSGSVLLGVERAGALDNPLELHIAPADRKAFREFIASVFKGPGKAVCELGLVSQGPHVSARLEGSLSPDGQTCLTMMQDITERKALQDAQDFLLRCGLKPGGLDFFQDLTRYLAQVLDADCVSIERLSGERYTTEVLAAYAGGQFQSSAPSSLENSPGNGVVDKAARSYPKRARLLFPKDARLQALQAESYVGATLWSAEGQPIGLIAAMGSKRQVNQQLAEALLHMVGIRVAGELERLKAV
ncbi:MAG TPA: GAF domain-containing protein [Humidesulfovibrio sp.]|uniref:GAF domain-containing protein n=1 Tax=Humidesulfovibrio sp. TaxID=2910988 RepID=UPI002BD78C42|nr:GAF domain-containing protein [Humidesulfovibrio sp.]HWR02761.1 GAF domain-containing protein [Humidesulfovibrio sp.]